MSGQGRATMWLLGFFLGTLAFVALTDPADPGSPCYDLRTATIACR